MLPAARVRVNRTVYDDGDRVIGPCGRGETPSGGLWYLVPQRTALTVTGVVRGLRHVIHYSQFDEHERFRRAWESVRIVRSVSYSLFTFGDSDLPYFLVCNPAGDDVKVSIKRGEVKMTRPLIISADSPNAEFRDFFENQEGEEVARFVLARSARFPNVKFANVVESEQFVSDSVEEAVARITRKLDDEEEDRVAVLTAPAGLGGVAVLRYCVERVAKSAPDNLNELQERGFLPHP